MRAHASGSREVIRLDYVPYMKEILLTKLLEGEERIEEVVEFLDACEISREDLTESMESFKLPEVKRLSYAQLDTKAKSAFTRLYNKASHKSQAVVEKELLSTTVKKGRGRAAAAPDDTEDGLPPPSDAEEESDKGEDDEIDLSKFQKKGRGAAAASKRKAPASKASTSKAATAKKRKA
ncbi:hypothetical protein ATCC90586_008564 [Pythium insidiosum]|nr:hypothetical protein ATCC90586_008564 [Pythium insidiosum]